MKFYVVGDAEVMKRFFPNYQGRDERFSLDGTQVIYELDLPEDQASTLSERSEGLLKPMLHGEIVQYLADNALIWDASSDSSSGKRKGKRGASLAQDGGSS